MDNRLPVYSYPTLTVLIDDSRSFLDSLAFQLNPRIGYKIFHDTRETLDWLHDAQRYAAISDPIYAKSDELSQFFERHSASIDLSRIYHIAMNRQRFSLPTVLVVDYAMPRTNGLELCQAVQGLPCKKILLTGQADEKVAVEAFNRNLIDRFIKKQDPNALNRLEEEIVRLQKDFFNERTSTLKDLLLDETYSFLSDPAMGSLVARIGSRYRFVEHYLFPHPSGILFFDIRGKATLMVIETAAGLISHAEIAEDQNAPPELLSALKAFRLVPFFSDTSGMYSDAISHDWLSYCLPPQICHGRQDYYWALFDLPSHYLKGTVYPYAEFLKTQSI